MSAALAAAVLGHGAPTCAADDPFGLAKLRDQARAIEQQGEQATAPAWLRPEWRPAAQALGSETARTALESVQRGQVGASACGDLGPVCEAALGHGGVAADGSASLTFDVLVSRSLGPAALREIFAAVAGKTSVKIVFRGVSRGEKLRAFVGEIRSYIPPRGPEPNVEIDPTAFRDPSTEFAPVIVAHRGAVQVARVSGLTNVDWLEAEIRAGRRGDLGVRGPVSEISERDLVQELQERAAGLDLQKMRDGAVDRYWAHAQFEDLPPATAAREREVDPTVRAAGDIALPDGRYLVRAGETLNPLDQLPFDQLLVVFDGSDPAQVRAAKRLGASAGKRRLVYLATRLERKEGWGSLQGIEDTLDAPVYLLTPEVRQRFLLERVPSTVEAKGNRFVVREVPVDRGAAQ